MRRFDPIIDHTYSAAQYEQSLFLSQTPSTNKKVRHWTHYGSAQRAMHSHTVPVSCYWFSESSQDSNVRPRCQYGLSTNSREPRRLWFRCPLCVDKSAQSFLKAHLPTTQNRDNRKIILEQVKTCPADNLAVSLQFELPLSTARLCLQTGHSCQKGYLILPM